jgi:hypothetical protein
MNWIIAKKKRPRTSSKIGERYFLVETLGGKYEVAQYFKGMKGKFTNKDERQNRFAIYISNGCYWQTVRDVVKWIKIQSTLK